MHEIRGGKVYPWMSNTTPGKDLVMHRRLFHIIGVAVGICGLALLPTAARADLVVAGDTDSSHFGSSGTSKTLGGLTFTAGNFDSSKSSTLDLGTLALSPQTDLYAANDAFHLLIDFSAPQGISGPTPDFTADILGVVLWGMGGVTVDFDNWSQTFSFNNSTGSGSFTLTLAPVNIILGHDVVAIAAGSSTHITAQVKNVSYTAVPEPGVVLLLTVMLLGVGLTVRKLRWTN